MYGSIYVMHSHQERHDPEETEPVPLSNGAPQGPTNAVDVPFALQQLSLATVQDIEEVDVDECLRVKHACWVHQECA